MKNYLDSINKILEKIKNADAILIGAGAGFSAAAGHTYSGDRFHKNFNDFHSKYGIPDMYSGGFYNFKTEEEFYAWWSRQIYLNRYSEQESQLYKNLLHLLKDKNYFVLTTNVDHMFQDNGFDKSRLFYTQGDYGLFQCKTACHNKTYDNKDLVFKMRSEQENMLVPSYLIPKCPVCGGKMDMNLRKDNYFVQDDGWYLASRRYSDFINENRDKNLVLIELGVGMNTPSIIKYPFWRLTYNNKNASFITINKGEASVPKEIIGQSIAIDEDIKKVFEDMINVV